jgi:ubiquitin-like 1-activating enzyme E1 B
MLMCFMASAEEIKSLKHEAEELKDIREKMDRPDFVESIFEKVFTRDIDRLRSMEGMWKLRKAPDTLEFAKVKGRANGLDSKVAREDQKTWSLEENFVVFADSIKRLATRMLNLKANTRKGDAPPILSFDKDDEDTLDFVAASANLRSSIFGIDLKSKFDIKRRCTPHVLKR